MINILQNDLLSKQFIQKALKFTFKLYDSM